MPESGNSGRGSVLPFVTVVVPVRNEEGSIAASLRAVLEQDYPANRLEVIVADGMSEDRTRDVVTSTVALAGPDAPQVTIVDNAERTAPAGLNAAMEVANGQVIIRIDGHCRVQSDYVSRCVRLLEQTGAENVGGAQVGVGHGIVGRAIARATSSPFGVGNARFRYATHAGWVDTVYLGAWPREVFDRIGGFDEELVRNQDDEHNFRILQAGGGIWFDPALRTRYEVRASLPTLWGQYFGYGLYKVRVIQKRRAVASWRHIVPAAFVVALTGTVVVGALTRTPKLILVVVVPYLTVNAAASVHAARGEPGELAVLPLAFATLHLGYGSGFLAGLWRWRQFHGSAAR